MLDRIVGRAYLSSDAVETLIFSAFSLGSIGFSLVCFITVNNIDYYNRKTCFVKRIKRKSGIVYK